MTTIFDPGIISSHCAMLFNRVPNIDGKLVVSIFAENPDTGVKWARNHHFAVAERNIDAMVACIMQYATIPHANVYAPLAIMRPDLEEGRKGGEADVIGVLGGVCDSDADKGSPSVAPFEPDLIIESSAGNHQHVCFFQYPITVEYAKPFLERLHSAAGGDAATKDCSHVWRIPGCLNWPTKRKLERGRPRDPQAVRILKPYAGTFVPWETWSSLPPLPEHPREAEQPIQTNTQGTPPDVALLMMGLPEHLKFVITTPPTESTDRSQLIASVVSELNRRNWSKESIVAVIAAHPNGIGEKYARRNDLGAEIERLLGKFSDGSGGASPILNNSIENAEKLRGEELPPIKYVVSDLITEGATILAGKPKVKKSWLVLDAGLAVAMGGEFLGRQCEQGSVLYLALEDNKRRLKDRIKKILGPFSEIIEWPKAFHYATAWPRSHEGGLEQIRAWIDAHPDARMVIVDVLARFRAPSGAKQSAYEGDYNAIAELQKIAIEKRVAVIIVHHLRKSASEDGDPFDEVSGTLGLGGASDGGLILKRMPTGGATLYGRGRDVEEVELALSFDPSRCRWKAMGRPDEVFTSDARKKIIEVLREDQMKPADIAAITGLKPANVRKLIQKMAREGQIIRTPTGEYYAVTPVTPVTSDPNHWNHYGTPMTGGVTGTDRPITPPPSPPPCGL